jgi:hypothetical protein
MASMSWPMKLSCSLAVRSAAQRAVMSTSMPMMAGRPSNSVRMPKTSSSIGCRPCAAGSCSGRSRCAVDALAMASHLARSRGDQVVGADAPQISSWV